MKEFSAEFGHTMTCVGIPFSGYLDADQAKDLAYRIVEAIGMTPVSWHLETFDGLGVGFTGVLFLIESQVTIDSYLPHGEQGYLWVNSCKPFSITDAVRPLADFGLKVLPGAYQKEMQS